MKEVIVEKPVIKYIERDSKKQGLENEDKELNERD